MPRQPRKERETPRLPAQRRADLAEFVEEHGQATVGMLVEAFDVSGDTVRRDLQYLHEQGVVVRSYGGVVRRDDLARSDRESWGAVGAAAGVELLWWLRLDTRTTQGSRTRVLNR